MKILTLETQSFIRYLDVLKAKHRENTCTYSAGVILVLMVVDSGRLLERAVNSGLLQRGMQCSLGSWATVKVLCAEGRKSNGQ
jgi:hypothetical protein